MTRITSTGLRLAAMAVAALVLVAGGAQADEHEKKVRVKKIIHECDGDDCEEHERHVRKIFIGGDGGAQVLDGDEMTWISGGDGKHFRMMGPHGMGGGFLGVGLTELTPELRSHFGVPEDAGVMVSKVMDDSPAMLAGLQAGDIITAVSGESVGSGSSLAHEIRGREDGESVSLEVWRDGRMQTIDAAVEERETKWEHRSAHGMAHAIKIDCDDDEGDCDVLVDLAEGHGNVCGDDADECEVRIQCEDDGECDCTVNGDATDCESLPGFHAMHGD